jgi:hypothetical protein
MNKTAFRHGSIDQEVSMKLMTLSKRPHAHTSTRRNVSPAIGARITATGTRTSRFLRSCSLLTSTLKREAGASRFTAQQIRKRNMEILVFGLIAMRNGYRQQRETFVREPDEFQPFDVRALAA